MPELLRQFRYCTGLNASLETVIAFHKDPRALKRLTPPPVFVQIHAAQPLAEGSYSEFTMWIGPLPVRWVARHFNVDMRQGFSDEQVQGPFARWVHRHQFLDGEEGVSIVADQVEAVYGPGVWRGLLSRLMWWGLPVMFAYRAWVLKRALQGG